MFLPFLGNFRSFSNQSILCWYINKSSKEYL